MSGLNKFQNKQALIYLLVAGILISIITYLLIVISGSFRDDKNVGRGVEGVSDWSNNSIDVSSQSSRQLVENSEDSHNGASGNSDIESNFSVNADDVETILTEIESAVEEKNSSKLYGILSDELKSVFDEQSVVDGLAGVSVLDLTRDGHVQFLNKDHVMQRWVGKHDLDERHAYVAVLRREHGQWKLFGTVKE